MDKRNEWTVLGIIFVSVGVVASVLFGLIFGLSLWYSFALRCAIFATLGYWIAKKEPFKAILPKDNKVLSYLILIALFTLAFLFVFGLIFVVVDLAGETLSSIIPFTLAIIFTAKWSDIKEAITSAKNKPKKREDEKAVDESSVEESVDAEHSDESDISSSDDADEDSEIYIDEDS